MTSMLKQRTYAKTDDVYARTNNTYAKPVVSMID
jgi:hypothetical protein